MQLIVLPDLRKTGSDGKFFCNRRSGDEKVSDMDRKECIILPYNRLSLSLPPENFTGQKFCYHSVPTEAKF